MPSGGTTPVADATSTYAQFPDYGVLWSYGPAYKADASATPQVDDPFTPAEANQNPMYSFAKPPTTLSYFDTTGTGYPTTTGAGFPAGTAPAPYNQISGAYFLSGGASGVLNRRVLNIVLVDCRTAPVGPPSCGKLNAVGIGKFFMPTRADTTGFSRLDLEFAGLITPVPKSEIKLYK